MFKEAGYETALCGKWHLGSSFEHGPQKFGFDQSYGSLTGAVGMYDHRYREGEFFNTWHRNGELIEDSDNGTHAADLVADDAVRVIETKREKPFFLYVPFHNIHTPLDERGEFVDQPTKLDPEKPGRWNNEDEIKWFNDPDGIIQKETDPEKRLLLATAYHLDDAVGKIVAALDKTGQRDNTLILFSSDNGPQGNWGGDAYPSDLKLTDFNQPLPMRGKKVDVWEGGIHVPGFAKWPGKIEPKEVTEVVHIIDWFPTLAKQIGFSSEEVVPWDGIDISKCVFDDEPITDRDLYWVWNARMNRWAMRHGDWKVVKYGQGVPGQSDWQLYNLKDDPKEKTNVADANPAMVSQLHQRFLQHRTLDKVGK
jgi:arylsulfatase A-like enzyme